MSERNVLPQPVLYVVVNRAEGTHHGTFDYRSIAESEAAIVRDETGDEACVYVYKRGKCLSVYA